MPKLENLLGRKFGRLTPVSLISTDKNGAKWLCLCDCGNYTESLAHSLKIGRKKSCGCLSTPTGKYTCGNDKRKRLSSTLRSIRQRCYNPNNKDYCYYGARGIKVCNEWKDLNNFINWSLSNDYQIGLTIDRINNDGNYEPNNCRYISRSENSKYQPNKKGWVRKRNFNQLEMVEIA